MPRFFKDMPKPHAGVYEAIVVRTNPFNSGRVVYCETFNGRLRAYLAVRFAALMWDLATPYADGELGINWEIRGVK